jgi:adenylate cyclase
MESGERRLAAIMFTDIVGYTRLAQSDESLALELLEEHRGVLRPAFQAHGGTEVKTMGDAFLVEFRSALEALLCAVEMQEKMRVRNAGVPTPRRLDLRIGIHVGDIVHRQGDVQGDAVNVASRIEPLAEPGGICISQQVFDQVRNKTDLTIERMKEIRLKNVKVPLEVYRVLPPLPHDGPSKKDEHRAPRERLAVLPFVNISPDPGDEYFADGLTEELISRLSEIRGLKVIARTSVMSYKRTGKKVSEIAAELGVGSIVEGSVRKAGNKIRVTVQLVDAGTEEHLWASNYNKELDDIFAIQSDVASRVAGSLSSGFFGGLQRDTGDIEAYTLYLRGLQASHASTESSLRESVTLFDRAVERDPSFVRAQAALSSAWGKIVSGGYEDFRLISEKAEPAARAALEAGPDFAEAHAAMANVHFLLDRFDEGAAECEEAIRINPNLSEAHALLGLLYAHHRSLDESLRELQRAYELDPLSFNGLIYLEMVAQVAGRSILALEILEKMKVLSPNNPRAYVGTAEYYMKEGDFPRAQEALDIARRLGPSEPLIKLNQGILYAMEGRRREADEMLDEVLKDKSESVRLYGVLYIQAALGNVDAAFGALDRMAETHSWPFLLKVHPLFEGLRRDPRYPEFCRKVGLTP